jgi:beta-alanine degradation protein BauB
VHVLVVELKKEAGSKAPAGDDPVKIDPEGYKVLFENDRVRVLDSRLKQGSATGMHAHPASVVYAIKSYKIEFTSKDGTKNVVEQKAGEARWIEPVLHSNKQLGDKPAHALVFELKK